MTDLPEDIEDRALSLKYKDLVPFFDRRLKETERRFSKGQKQFEALKQRTNEPSPNYSELRKER